MAATLPDFGADTKPGLPDFGASKLPDFGDDSAPKPPAISHRYPGVSTTDGGTEGGGLHVEPFTMNDLPDAESVHEVYSDISRPAVPIPKFTVNPNDSTTVATGKEAANVLLGVPEFVESPLGIATLGTGAILPKTVATVFTADTLHSLGKQVRDTHANWDQMTPAQQSAAIVDMTGSAEFSMVMGHGAVKGIPAENADEPASAAASAERPNAETPPAAALPEFEKATLPNFADTQQTQTPNEINEPETTDPTEPAEPVANGGPGAAGEPAAEQVQPGEETAEPAKPLQQPQPGTTAGLPDVGGEPPPANVPKLIPVDVSPEQVASMATEQERPPDVLDDIENITSQPVQFDPKQHGNLVADAVQATLRPSGKPSAATKRLNAVISDKAGEPVDKVLQGLAAQNPKYADWTPDDLGAAIIGAHQLRENPPIDLNARVLAEQQARDNLFNQANQAGRPGVESVPVEQTQLGDTFTVNGHPMAVVDHPVDADTGKISGVQLAGAYGRQNLAVGQSIHMDAGSLKEDVNSGALGNLKRSLVIPFDKGVKVAPVHPTEIVHEDKAGLYGSRYIWAVIDGHPWKIRIADHDAGQSSAPKLPEVIKARAAQLKDAATIPNENAFTLHWKTDEPADVKFSDIVKAVRNNVADEFYTHPDAEFGGTLDIYKGWHERPDDVEVEGGFEKESALQSGSSGIPPSPTSAPGISTGKPEKIESRMVQSGTTKTQGEQSVNTEMVGMGAARYGETKPLPLKTNIANAQVDAARQARGLPPILSRARGSNAEMWDRTMQRIEDDPQWPERVLAEVSAQPRTLTPEETLAMDRQQVMLQNDFEQTTRNLLQAREDAQAFPESARADDAARLQLEQANLSDQMQEFERAMRDVGSEWGASGQMRQRMMREDYSLAAMEMKARAAKGRALTPEELNQVSKAQAAELASRRKYEELQKQVEDERAKRMVDDEIAARLDQVTKTPGYDRQVNSLADRIVTALEAEAVKARARLKEKFSRLNAGVDPTLITDLATVGAAHIARGTLDFSRWSKAMVADFGESVIPWLNQAWAKANSRVDTAVDRLSKGKQSIAVKQRIRKDDVSGNRENIVNSLKNAAQENRPLDEQGDHIRKLMENFIQSGIKTREPLVDAVHKTLTDDIGLDVTRRDTMEAMSNYGRFKALNPDEIKATRRDLSHQIAQTLKLSDIEARRPLPKSGVEQHVPSTEGRLLEQQVNEAKRRYGVVTDDPAKQLKSALEARKTWLNNRIADVKFQIAKGERFVKTKTPGPEDAETTRLKLELADLSKQLDDVAPKPGITDAQRAALAERSLARENDFLEKQIAAGEVSLKSSRPQITSAQLEALRARNTALKAQRDELRAMDPKYQQTLQQRAIKSYIARLTANDAKLADRTARGDFAPQPRRTWAWQQDPKVLAAKAANQAVRNDFERALNKDRLNRRTLFQKGMDGIAKWKRTFVLSWPTVLAKLTSAAAQGIVTAPLEEGIGSVSRRMFPAIAARAPRHGSGLNLRAEVSAISDTITHAVTDFKGALKSGRTELDLVHGKPEILPREFKDFVGNFHYALKTPLMRNEFARSYSNLMQGEAAKGVDVTSPLVQQRLGNQAYQLAQKAIFKENNLVTRMYKRALSATRDQVDGAQTRTGKMAEAGLKFTFPVVDIPTTIVKRTFEYALGLPLGLGRAGLAYAKGIDNLKPDEAEAIMRNLKRGKLGAAVLALGFFNPQMFGGFYQPGEKRPDADVKPGAGRIGGHNISHLLFDTPLAQQLQIGATIRRVADEQMSKSNPGKKGIGTGAWAALLGLVDEVPFLGGIKPIVDNPTPTSVVGGLAKSAIPGALQFTAAELDKDQNGNTISRKPATIAQTVETGIPGLRQNVPARVPPEVQKSVSRAMELMKLPKLTPSARDLIRSNMERNYMNAPATNSLSTRLLNRFK